MDEILKNCWVIKHCGREKNGCNEHELGECIASKKGFGHSCWSIAGTLCDEKVQGTFAEKVGYCSSCEVYKLYNRSLGIKGKEVEKCFPEEKEKYAKLMLIRYKKMKKYEKTNK